MGKVGISLFLFFFGTSSIFSKGIGRAAKVVDKDKLPLDLVNIIDIALQRNNNIKISYLGVDMGESDVKISKSAFFPTITARGGYAYSKNLDTKDSANNRELSLGASYTVFVFGRDKKRAEQMEYALNQLNYGNNETIQNIIYDISASYYKILRLLAEKNSLVESEKLSSETLKAASLKHKLGIAVLADKLSAKAGNSRDRLRLIQVDRDIKNSKSELNLLLNLESNYDLFIEEPEIKIKKSKIGFSELLEIALKKRNDLRKKLEEKKIKEKEIEIVRLEKLPTVELSAGISENDSYGQDNTNSNISVGVSVPLFSGFRNTNQIRKAKSDLKKTDIEIEEMKNMIAQEVWTAHNNLATSEQSFSIAKETLESESAHAKLMLGMYKNGKSSILQVLDANDKLQNARFELIATKYDWLNYRIALLKVIGRMTIENINNPEEF
ncbi:MAG: TolC family protein [Rickettsiales bacterium]|jgi:outer membrane protein|nr:TolC family protein [Rickettsiales bacterium]